jgi:hypothetical protein
MELKLKSDIFYLLDAGSEKRIYDDESDSVEALRAIFSQNEDVEAESVKILEINTSEEKWEVKSVPWSRIAKWLLKGKVQANEERDVEATSASEEE